MSEDKHLEEKEKLEAEITRSLSVAKIKEAHKQIEDIEKLRKQASIKSICERILSCMKISKSIVNAMEKERKKQNVDLGLGIEENGPLSKVLNTINKIYESMYFDFQKTTDIKKEDFDKLFPKIDLAFTTYESVVINLTCLNITLTDMKNYCLRLL